MIPQFSVGHEPTFGNHKPADLLHLHSIFDVLYANAGAGEFAPLQDNNEDHFDRTFGNNVKGTPFTVKKALPLLRDGASIILTSAGMPAFSVYSATRAAIRNFARGWIVDLAPRRIRVNVLVPGSTSTPGWPPIGSDRRIPSEDGGNGVRSGPSWAHGRTG